MQRSVNNTLCLILITGDTLAHLYTNDRPNISEWRRQQSQHLLQELQQRQFRRDNVFEAHVAPITLNYLLSSLGESHGIIQDLKAKGVKIPAGYRFERVSLDGAELDAGELEYAIVEKFSIIVTHLPARYGVRDSGRIPQVWKVESLLFRLALLDREYSSPTGASTQVVSDSADLKQNTRLRSSTPLLILRTIIRHALQFHPVKQGTASSQAPKQPAPPNWVGATPERNANKFHAPTSGTAKNTAGNIAISQLENAIKSTVANLTNNVRNQVFSRLINQGGQFSGLWLVTQIDISNEHNAFAVEMRQRSPIQPSMQLQNVDLTRLIEPQKTELQLSRFFGGEVSRTFESKNDRPFVSQRSTVFWQEEIDRVEGASFEIALPTPTSETPSLALETTISSTPHPESHQSAVSISFDRETEVKPSVIVGLPNNGSGESGKPGSYENSAAPLPILQSQVFDGLGGNRFVLISENSGRYEINHFGGVGRGVNPSLEVIREVDTLQFQGSQLSAKNLLLDQKGNDLLVTFEGVQTVEIVLKNFALENLDNLANETGASITIGNLRFEGDQQTKDSFDVLNQDQVIDRVFNPNSVTFLNDLDNIVSGLDNSDDVINGQGGDDILLGRGGNDILRGGAGRDLLDGGTGMNILTGGSGSDIFVICKAGFSQVNDFRLGEDRIGLPEDVKADQLTIEQGTAVNSSSTLIRLKSDGSLLMSLSGVMASTLTTDIFTPVRFDSFPLKQLG